jgi:hypothetical protein
MVVGADTDRFGQLIERLQQSYSVGNNNYPLTINDAKLYLERTEDNKTSNKKRSRPTKNNSIRLTNLRRRKLTRMKKQNYPFRRFDLATYVEKRVTRRDDVISATLHRRTNGTSINFRRKKNKHPILQRRTSCKPRHGTPSDPFPWAHFAGVLGSFRSSSKIPQECVGTYVSYPNIHRTIYLNSPPCHHPIIEIIYHT